MQLQLRASTGRSLVANGARTVEWARDQRDGQRRPPDAQRRRAPRRGASLVRGQDFRERDQPQCRRRAGRRGSARDWAAHTLPRLQGIRVSFQDPFSTQRLYGMCILHLALGIAFLCLR